MPTQRWEIRKLGPEEELAGPCFFKLEVMGRSLLPSDRRDGWASACYTLSHNGKGSLEANMCRERWVGGKIVRVTCDGDILAYGFQPDGEFYSNSTGVVAHEYRTPGEPPLLKPRMSVGYCTTL